MSDDLEISLKRLKEDYLKLERVNLDEREGMAKVINIMGAVMTTHGEMADEIKAIKDIVSTDVPLPLDQLDAALGNLKEKVLKLESEEEIEEGPDPIEVLNHRLIEYCKIIREIVAEILDNFYPIPDELKDQADAININCAEELAKNTLKETSGQFLSFLGGLRGRITEDFRYINKTFITLLDQVKELERTLKDEFGKDDHIKEIEYFEMKINRETVSILDSFNIYATLSEIKSTVINKLDNIKELVSIRKKEETRKFKLAQENIKALQGKINDAEKDARVMSKKAKHLQAVAMQDGLTGLYNRKTFDTRLDSALKSFNEMEDIFSLIIFDLNDFKKINDTFGHVAGDKVLIKVSECLKETFRRDDFIARYGGDEFAVIVDQLTKELAGDRVQKFNENLKKRRFVSYTKGEIGITVSAGIAAVQDGDTAESLIERADKFMYITKEKSK